MGSIAGRRHKLLKIKQNNLPHLLSRLRELQKSQGSIGYYNEQGEHSTSGLRYVDLFGIQSFGSTKVKIPPRPVLDLTFDLYNPLSKNMTLKRDLKLYFSNIKSKTPRIKAEQILENVLGDYVEKVRSYFADPTKIESNSAFTQWLKEKNGLVPNSPLVWSGELRDNLSYKINGQPLVTP